MHGKIVQYSHDTHIGTIINSHKKLFDFRLHNWHDNSMIPEINLLVEFRLDEDTAKVVDVKASKYQDFEDGVIKESEFWHTDTDEELEKVEYSAFEDMVSETLKNTNYESLREILPSISIEKFIQYHFDNEEKIIQRAYDLSIDGYEKLDYRIAYPFIKRAIDILIFADRKINQTTFAVYLQLFSKLKYFTDDYYKVQQKTETVFNEKFSAQQLYYTAAMKRLAGLKEEIMRLEMSQNNLKSEARLDEASKAIAKATALLARIKNLAERFIETNKDAFFEAFDKRKARIFENVIVALNVVVTAMDNKVWSLGMNSTPVRNYFFKLQASHAFCAIAFLENYIKRLDPSKLSDKDKLLYNYFNAYTKRNTRRILIVTDRPAIEVNLRLDIIESYKDFFVAILHKKMEYNITIINEKFDIIILDKVTLKDENLIEMILLGRTSKLNGGAKYILLDE